MLQTPRRVAQVAASEIDPSVSPYPADGAKIMNIAQRAWDHRWLVWKHTPSAVTAMQWEIVGSFYEYADAVEFKRTHSQ